MFAWLETRNKRGNISQTLLVSLIQGNLRGKMLETYGGLISQTHQEKNTMEMSENRDEVCIRRAVGGPSYPFLAFCSDRTGYLYYPSTPESRLDSQPRWQDLC